MKILSFVSLNIILFFGVIYLLGLDVKDPKIGEVWEYNPRSKNTNNPFITKVMLKPSYRYKVVDLKNDYVQYMDLYDSTISSSSIRMFKAGAKCVKNCQ